VIQALTANELQGQNYTQELIPNQDGLIDPSEW